MNYFKTIKAALDASISGICKNRSLSRKEAYKGVKVHLATMREEWFSGEQPNITYQDPLCRFAYLYSHTAANANLFEFAIRESPDIAAMISAHLSDPGELRVCAFGGGPGTELLAIAKHLIKTGHPSPPGTISFTLIDIVVEWSETWNALEAEIKRQLRDTYGKPMNFPFSIAKSFIPFDMLNTDAFANMPQILEHDLYAFNYVISEILGERTKLQKLVDTMAQAAPTGAKFLIVDRDQSAVRKDATNLLQNAGLSCSKCRASATNMDLDERSEILESYATAIGRSPRVQWGGNGKKGAFWVIGTKEA